MSEDSYEFLDRWRGAIFYQWMCDLHENCRNNPGTNSSLRNTLRSIKSYLTLDVEVYRVIVYCSKRVWCHLLREAVIICVCYARVRYRIRVNRFTPNCFWAMKNQTVYSVYYTLTSALSGQNRVIGTGCIACVNCKWIWGQTINISARPAVPTRW